MQVSLISSPVLARFDPLNITFLKTDWSSEGMGWILMQPDDNDAFIAAANKLKSDGICDFDLALNGARLKPMSFGSRGCNKNERSCYSFTGEGRVAVGLSLRIANAFGVAIFIGSVTIQLSKKSSNMMEIFL